MNKLVLISCLSLVSITIGICDDSLVGSVCKLKKGSYVSLQEPPLGTELDDNFQSRAQIVITVTGEGRDCDIVKFNGRVLFVHAEDLQPITK